MDYSTYVIIGINILTFLYVLSLCKSIDLTDDSVNLLRMQIRIYENRIKQLTKEKENGC